MDYQSYMRSAAWATKRAARLAIDGYRCRLCGATAKEARLEVHHRPDSYKLIPNESVEEHLTTLCASPDGGCHDPITDRIRRARYASRSTPDIPILITERILVERTSADGIQETDIQNRRNHAVDYAQRTACRSIKPIQEPKKPSEGKTPSWESSSKKRQTLSTTAPASQTNFGRTSDFDLRAE